MLGRMVRKFWCGCLACVLPLLAVGQEGYPLDGTWRGEWGQPGEPGNHVVIVMKWNGETITGRINPGPNSIDFENAWLEADNWGVHIEAQTPGGETIRIDGTLSDIGSYNRRVTGSWRQGATSYELSLTRE